VQGSVPGTMKSLLFWTYVLYAKKHFEFAHSRMKAWTGQHRSNHPHFLCMFGIGHKAVLLGPSKDLKMRQQVELWNQGQTELFAFRVEKLRRQVPE
jgi:hypothetical protein